MNTGSGKASCRWMRAVPRVSRTMPVRSAVSVGARGAVISISCSRFSLRGAISGEQGADPVRRRDAEALEGEARNHRPEDEGQAEDGLLAAHDLPLFASRDAARDEGRQSRDGEPDAYG